MQPFKISGVSFMPDLWKHKKNLKTLLTYIDEAANQGAQVIASCEGALDGYITRDLPKHKIRPEDKHIKGYNERVKKFRVKQEDLAKKIKTDCIPALCKKAAEHGVYLFINTLDHRRKGAVYNTTFVIDPEGKIIGTYDKIHAAFEVVNKLGKGYPVFETPYAPIGVIVCADRQFPETARAVALNGANVLIINSYGMWGEGANERFIRQRAYENGLYVLFCHPRETVLVSPEGRIIASTCAWENVLVRSIDPTQAASKGLFGNREMAQTYAVLGDPSAYAKLKKR
ncbi:MAG: carbon-nitrogen hydrolase family protein [bacterium]|nr:carbon-nitrogen hydrolase family protein [bacterium]